MYPKVEAYKFSFELSEIFQLSCRNLNKIQLYGKNSRAAGPWGPVDARLEGRVALTDGSVRIVLECIHLQGKSAPLLMPAL